MKVDLLAWTIIDTSVMHDAYGYEPFAVSCPGHADALAEFAGRLCYKSFERPRPKTASNVGYLANIIEQQHFSVLEHSSMSLLVRGVSRALLAELTRHRHLSFSVVSQRYVDYADTEPVTPPALEGYESVIGTAYAEAIDAYEALVNVLLEEGLGRKRAREAARCVLPNAAPVDMVVTGNVRAWRDVLAKRWHVAADAEIREFAGLVLEHLRDVAPNSVQDIPSKPYGSKEGSD